MNHDYNSKVEIRCYSIEIHLVFTDNQEDYDKFLQRENSNSTIITSPSNANEINERCKINWPTEYS